MAEEEAFLYTSYVVVPGSQELLDAKVTRVLSEAALNVADALVNAPPAALGVVTKVPLNTYVSTALDQLERVEMIGTREDFPRPRARVTLGLLPKHDADDGHDDRGDRQDQRPG